MTMHRPIEGHQGFQAFPDSARVGFAAAYPDRPMRIDHNLCGHPLLTREAIAALGERLPESSIEYNAGKMPVGIAPEDTPQNGLSIADTIRTIDTNGSWMVLKNVEQDPAYAALLDGALAELDPIVQRRTGPMLHREAFIFFTSPDSITPFHMDPEHNILLQIEGEKTMNVFPVGDEALVSAEQSEAFHKGGHRNLPWQEGFAAKGEAVHLSPGQAVIMPVKAPHFVQNGPAVSISFSITWRSARSVAEGELHSLNDRLRQRGLPTARVGAKPESSHFRLLLAKVMRKLGA